MGHKKTGSNLLLALFVFRLISQGGDRPPLLVPANNHDGGFVIPVPAPVDYPHPFVHIATDAPSSAPASTHPSQSPAPQYPPPSPFSFTPAHSPSFVDLTEEVEPATGDGATGATNGTIVAVTPTTPITFPTPPAVPSGNATVPNSTGPAPPATNAARLRLPKRGRTTATLPKTAPPSPAPSDVDLGSCSGDDVDGGMPTCPHVPPAVPRSVTCRDRERAARRVRDLCRKAVARAQQAYHMGQVAGADRVEQLALVDASNTFFEEALEENEAFHMMAVRRRGPVPTASDNAISDTRRFVKWVSDHLGFGSGSG